jgi:hypothetical protein
MAPRLPRPYVTIVGYRVVVRAVSLVVALFLFGALLSFPTLGQGSPKPGSVSIKGCYAYGANWRIFVVCGGKKEWINVPYPIEDFAISSDGSSLAFWKVQRVAAGTEETESAAQWVTGLVKVLLSPGFTSTEKQASFKSIPSLQATCGTIVGFHPGTMSFQKEAWDFSAPSGAPLYPPPDDVLAGKPLQFPLSDIFRCSADRNVLVNMVQGSVAGTREFVFSVGGKEVRKFPAESKTVTPWARNDFSVSPSGRYFAYFYAPENHYRSFLCVSREGGLPACAPAQGKSPAVSDSGGVLYSVFGGSPPVEGIAYWRPGLPKSIILERERYDSLFPQWITTDFVLRLKQWAAFTTSSANSH